MTILRKNAAHLTDAEWQAFCNALLAMKKAGVYDDFVIRHATATSTNGAIRALTGNTQFRAEVYDTNGAHRGPAFLVWHRAMLLEFETQVQQYIDSSFKGLGIPYWDWTQDPTGTKIFNKYLGTTKGEVTDGLFNAPDWSIERNPTGSGGIPFGPLRRALGSQSRPVSMPDMKTTVPAVMSCQVYDSFDNTNFGNSFRRNFEQQLHDVVHVWVGGQMGVPGLAPNDPVFYLHHSNVDRLFMRWQEMRPTSSYFQDLTVVMPPGQNYTDTLLELNSTPQQIWDYKQLSYTYERVNTIRRFAGVSHSPYPAPYGADSPVTLKFSMGSPPSSSSAVQVGFTGWLIWFSDDDHQLFRLAFDCKQSPYAGPIPTSLQGEIDLKDAAMADYMINVQPQVSMLFLTDASTFGALLVGRQTLSVSVSGGGKKSWSANLIPPEGAEFAMAFLSGVDMQYTDASHFIRGECVYIDPMPIDSVPNQVKGSVELWDNSGNNKVSAKLTLEVLYFGTNVLSSGLNYVLSGAIDKLITTVISDTSLTSSETLTVPDTTILTVPVIVGLDWNFLDNDHNLRGHRFGLTSTLSQLNYTGYLWDDGQDDSWDGSIHALVLCFSPYWV